MKIKVRAICQEGIDLVKEFEGYSDHAYICPAGYPTIGWGHRIQKDDEMERFGVKWEATERRWTVAPVTITEEEAEELLRKDLITAELAVQKYITVPLTDFQHAAIVSFTFNLGAGALLRSTLRSKLNRMEYISTADEFERWVYSKGRKLVGLVRRRLAEKQLFLAGTSLNGNGHAYGAD